MQEFAKRIKATKKPNFYTVTVSYFEFWEQHIDFLELLAKTNMLYFMGERLPDFIVHVALLIGHIEEKDLKKVPSNYFYTFHYNIAGFWSITTKWAEKSKRETPEEMAHIVAQLSKAEY